MKEFIQLHIEDTIVIALKIIEADSIINVNGKEIKIKETIDFGHKIAIKHIAKKEKILKYGLSIGSATEDIIPGEHVHSHNLKTDYFTIPNLL